MGGNALKKFGVETCRIPKSEYVALWKKVYFVLIGILTKNSREAPKVELIRSYEDKSDFGDMDVLVDSWNDNIQKLILEAFQPKAFYKNDKCLSLEVDGFQIDIIYAPPTYFNFARNYFAFNDLGNLIGRVAHKMGLKFGHDGLWYILRDGTQVLAEICLTTDFYEALHTLDYDRSRFVAGFQTLEDIFEYAVSSKYFNRDIYQLHNRNAISRERDRKRKTYSEFLKWIDLPEQIERLPKFEWDPDKSVYLLYLFDKFPHFKVEYDLAILRNEERKLIKEKFNGEYIGAWTGLQGPELGHFIGYLKTLTWWSEFVLYASIYQIEAFIKEEVKKWKTTA